MKSIESRIAVGLMLGDAEAVALRLAVLFVSRRLLTLEIPASGEKP